MESGGSKRAKSENPRLNAGEMRDLIAIEPFIMGDTRDPLRGPYETVYVFAETEDNAYSPLMKAVELANNGLTRSISISESGTGAGYPGFERYVEDLYSYGLPRDFTVENGKIRRIVVTGNPNTLSEAQALVHDIANRGGDLGVIAPPFHLVRAFMTAITALTHTAPETASSKNMWAIKGTDQPPFQTALHSQGVLSNTRVGLEYGEMDRLKRYQAQDFGGMVKPKDVINYMRERDERVGLLEYPGGRA